MTNPTYRPLDASPAQIDFLSSLVRQVILADSVTRQQQDDVGRAQTEHGRDVGGSRPARQSESAPMSQRVASGVRGAEW